MDWLTADLVFKSIATVIGLWILCWICGSALCLVVSEDAPELRSRIKRWLREKRWQWRSEFSPTWTRQQQQQESRIEFHGPSVSWPIRHKEQ